LSLRLLVPDAERRRGVLVMGRHARSRIQDPATLGLVVPEGWIGLYPRPDETPEQTAEWFDRTWELNRALAEEDRRMGRHPYEWDHLAAAA
jgi:hypothetical protein